MRVIAVKHIQKFCRANPLAAQAFMTWVDEARTIRWRTPQDIKNRYPSASFIGKNRVVFNIKGNEYRLVVAVAYLPQIVYIKFIGTHAQYDRIDAATVQME